MFYSINSLTKYNLNENGFYFHATYHGNDILYQIHQIVHDALWFEIANDILYQIHQIVHDALWFEIANDFPDRR